MAHTTNRAITSCQTLRCQKVRKRPLAYGASGICSISENTTGAFIYVAFQLSGKLDSYLADIDRQAEDMFLRLVNQIARQEGVTESLKTADQMAWIGRMNNIRNRAIEIVNAELIFA